MFWRGFGVLCVVGARLITLGAASLSSAGNGTKITSGNGVGLYGMERGSLGGGDGRSLRYGTEVGEVGELVRTGRAEEKEVMTTKGGEGWSISTMMRVGKGEMTTGTTEVWIETKVNLVSTCVPISTTKEGGRTSSDSSSSTLLSSSTRGPKICGWMESTSTIISRTVSATDAVKIGNALLASTERRSTSTRGMGPSTTLSRTRASRGIEESATVESTNQRTSASISTRSIQTIKHLSTANMSKHGSPSISLKTVATTTRSVASAVPSMSSTAGEMAQRKNSTLIFDLEEQHLKEDSDLVGNGNVAMAQDGGNGTTTSLDEEAQVRSNATKTEFREDRMTEAPKTSAPTVVSSNAIISDATAVESGNITSTEGSENEEQRPVRNNGTAYELESYGDANTTSQEFQAAIPTKSTISEATILSFSSQALPNIDSEAQPSNFTESLVAPVDGNASSSDVPEISSPQNITADSAPMMPNATLPVATEHLAKSTTNITSSTGLSTLSETVPEKDAMSNTTLIDGLRENATALPSNATSLSAIETGMAASTTTMNKGMKPNNGSTVLLNAINSTDLADAQVRRYIQRLGNALHMSQDNLKNIVCTDESLMNDMATLSRGEFDLVEQACYKLWEKHAELGTIEATGVSAVEVIANVTESMILESSPSNATAADKVEGFPSLANFTESGGNALERLIPTRTSTTALPTILTSMTLSSRMESATETSTGTSSLTMPTLSTSFTSASTSSNSKTTSTSSSKRPKMTACVDDFNFFAMTDANLDESGTIAWYMNWTAICAAQDGKFNSLGEVRYFDQAWLKDPDYDCGLEHGGCTRRPSCNSILSLYPDDEELARRIYFVMKMHSTINTVMKSYYDAIQLTHQNVAAQIHTIISTTMQTPHFDDAAACRSFKPRIPTSKRLPSVSTNLVPEWKAKDGTTLGSLISLYTPLRPRREFGGCSISIL